MYYVYIRNILLLTLLFFSTTDAAAQLTTTDWGLHDVGKVIEVVNNRGSLSGWGGDYEGLINAEYPPGSFVEHHGSIAPFYAGVSNNGQDTMVTTTSIYWWNSSNELAGYSSAPWDTVLDFPSQETSQRANALAINPGTEAAEKVGEVAVVPNPYRGDVDYNAMNPQWERPDPTRQRWLEQDRRIQFINLPEKSTVKIYTLSGQLVESLRHDDPTRGFEDWNLTNNVNQAVASGIYLFTVKNHQTGDVQTGKFVIIK